MNIENLTQNLGLLKLSGFAEHCEHLAKTAETKGESPLIFLGNLVDIELEKRNQARVEKLIKEANLPRTKSLKDFHTKGITGLTKTVLEKLKQGDFMDQYENVLIFGNPGTGKTHLCLALAYEWCLLGRRVIYTTAARLMQDLLVAKDEKRLTQFTKKMDRYEMLIVDDISYLPASRDESDLLFNLLSERYEMRSVMITSNLPFSKWDQIFKDEMTTTAAVDRLVHHAEILELNGESFRMKNAKQVKRVQNE